MPYLRSISNISCSRARRAGSGNVDHVPPLRARRFSMRHRNVGECHPHIAGRASFVINPAPWYIGVKAPSYFTDQKTGLDSAIVAVSNEGLVVPGVTVRVTQERTLTNMDRSAPTIQGIVIGYRFTMGKPRIEIVK